MKKSITIIGVNYFPEDTAIGLYTSQLANYFNSKNIEVNIITGFPYYPAWKISSNYKSKKTFYKENINGINIFRYKQYVPKNPTFFKRVLHLLDFTLGSFFNLFKIKKTDIVLCIVPFTSVIFLGKILSKLRKAKLWVHIQDFEFDAVTDSNIINSKENKSISFKLLFWIEKKLLNSVDLVSTISNLMVLKLSKKIKKDKKRILLPNWVDLDFVNPKTSKKHPYLESKKFKILYSGNIGEKQDWEFFIEFANMLKSNLDIEIIVVGNGSKREWLLDKVASLNNVSMYLPVAYNKLSDLLCSADLHILFQKNNVIDTVMPSKILAMMASQKPSIITGNLKSEVYSIINESSAGEYFCNTELEEVIKVVLQLKINKKLRNKYGENARKYVSTNFSKDIILKKFENTFLEL
ncbi:WcaI family glycosyltransferase [Polaribacter haliotis]|uniref:WcaI family glycosyltransferase n=1 Tax=Polaribacter haliotis TaxID=1888915 RepID=A0A7L8ACG2_9FLAO|nr:WcaI family glycosyltransferase [Polaribacter haliotis]QOD59671.1 WcaI family glycosyltransferase [Polaribacter haliotis]